MSRFPIRRALAAAATIISLAQPAAAQSVVDQSQTATSRFGLGMFPNLYGWDRAVSLWQSYTAGVDGSLTGINLQFGGVITDVDLKIYSGEGVDSPALHTTHFSGVANSTGFFLFNLASGVAQQAGQVYTFSFENLVCPNGDFSCGGYSYADYDAYAPGKFMGQGYYMPNAYHDGVTNADAAFQTLVTTTPEPATLTLMLLGFGMVGAAARRRRA